MKSTLFLASLMATPWAMRPDVLATYIQHLARGYSGRFEPSLQAERPIQARTITGGPRPSGTARARGGSIAILPLYGVIMPRANMLEMCGGGTSVETFTAAFRSAMADETVSQILIDIDSPGGSVYGVGELAAEIRAARAIKHVVGIANHVAASAAYWAGSACSELYVTPGGQVGSIGVIVAHEDISQALAQAGVNVTLITAGKFKAEGNAYAPLDVEARGNLQADVNSYGADFQNAVARGRGVGVDQVRKGMGQGRMLRGSAARAASMVDGIATFDEIVKKMQGLQRPVAASPGAVGLISLERNRTQLAAVGRISLERNRTQLAGLAADRPRTPSSADAEAIARRHRHRALLLELASA